VVKNTILLGLVVGLKNLVDRPFQKFEKSRPTSRPDSTKSGRLWSTKVDQSRQDVFEFFTKFNSVNWVRLNSPISTLKMEPAGRIRFQRIGTNDFDIRVQLEILYLRQLFRIDSVFENAHYFQAN
jgi:hypothetical protein